MKPKKELLRKKYSKKIFFSDKEQSQLLFSKLIDFDGIFKLFYAPFSTKF